MPELYNSGADFEKDGPGGEVDGYNFWAPVDALKRDRSASGVIGMAGNVSEWVDTWTYHPDFPDARCSGRDGRFLCVPITQHRRAQAGEKC